MMLCLLPWLLLEPPRLTLRAEPAVMFTGQVGELVVTLERPPAAAGVTLALPWLEEALTGLEGRETAAAWLARWSARPEGFVTRCGSAEIGWRRIAPERYEVRWPFRITAAGDGILEIPAARLFGQGFEWESTSAAVRVLAIPPATGPLPPWNLGVGRFVVDVTAAPRRIEPGGTLRLTLQVSGEGDLKMVPAPRLARWPGWVPEFFRILPLAATFERGQRLFPFEVQLRSAGGNVRLPSIQYGYFDPVTQRHEVRNVAGLTVEIAGGKPARTARDAPSADQLLPADVVLADRASSSSRDLRTLAWVLGWCGANLLAFVLLGERFGWPGASERARQRARVRRGVAAARRSLRQAHPPADLILEQFLAALPEAVKAREAGLVGETLQARATVLAHRFGAPGQAVGSEEAARRVLQAWEAAA